MFRAYKHHYLYTFACLLALLFAGCASMGRPGGGLYDEEPPVLRNSEPAYGATNVRKQRIVMHFNENIKLNEVNDKMVVSPPQLKMPTVTSNAKTLSIELQDTLKDNTTYSIDLGDAVQDNNEGNPMESLSLLFSTGDHIDSLQLAGYLLNAADLEPVTGAYVGIYKVLGEDGTPIVNSEGNDLNSLADSILLRYPFDRVGRSNEYGCWQILGCAPGSYRIYALKDGNTNYRYDMFSEDIAFVDGLVQPCQPSSTSIDTMLLRSFNEGKVMRYLDDCSRPDSIHINIRFASKMDTLPRLQFLQNTDSLPSGLLADSVLVVEANPTLDTLTYWIVDSALQATDSLLLQLSYAYTDTNFVDIVRTDTLMLIKPMVRASVGNNNKDKDSDKKHRKRKDKDADKNASADSLPQVTYMTIKMLTNNSLDIGKKPLFESSAPLDSICLEGIHLKVQRDTLWDDMQLTLMPDTTRLRCFYILAMPHYNPGQVYQLQVDSAAMHDVYGHPIAATSFSFKEKSPEDYAHLLFNISSCDTPAYVELLDGKDMPVQRAQVKGNQAKFVNVPAGTYYARLIADANGNGKHDTGSLFEHQQPEEVYYLNIALKLRANWSLDQAWDIKQAPLLKQKPEDVKINKPKEKKEKKSRNEEYLRKLGKL